MPKWIGHWFRLQGMKDFNEICGALEDSAQRICWGADGAFWARYAGDYGFPWMSGDLVDQMGDPSIETRQRENGCFMVSFGGWLIILGYLIPL